MPNGNHLRAWTYNEYVEKYEQLKTENEQLQKALKRYGCHEFDCTANGPGGCNCGLQQALKGAKNGSRCDNEN